MKRVHVVVVCALVALISAVGSGQAPNGGDRLNADVFSSLRVRNIGPMFVTGRIADIELDPKNPNVWYVASAFGGLWKTTNRGVTFTEIFPKSRDGRRVLAVLRGGRSQRLQRGVAGHGREPQPAQRALRHRPLQVG